MNASGWPKGRRVYFPASLPLTVATAPDFAWFVGVFHDEFVGVLLVPLDGGFGAVDGNVRLVSCGDLGSEKDAARATFVTAEHGAVVVGSSQGMNVFRSAATSSRRRPEMYWARFLRIRVPMSPMQLEMPEMENPCASWKWFRLFRRTLRRMRCRSPADTRLRF